MAKVKSKKDVYGAASRWVETCLERPTSLFTPSSSIWTPETAEDLYERFVGQPDFGSDRFEVKLSRQLDAAPDATIQLAAELLYVHLLMPRNFSLERKTDLIQTVLAWAKAPVPIPDDLRNALEPGIAKVGVAYNTYRPWQITFLLEFLRFWGKLAPLRDQKR